MLDNRLVARNFRPGAVELRSSGHAFWGGVYAAQTAYLVYKASDQDVEALITRAGLWGCSRARCMGAFCSEVLGLRV